MYQKIKKGLPGNLHGSWTRDSDNAYYPGFEG
jgi:hypothetical protein